MFCRSYTGGIRGIEAYCIHVEVDVSDGLPCFDMVGYLSSEAREARERIRTSLRNSGCRIPPKRVTVNLSPGDIRKEGTAFDLAVAMALLCALGHFPEELIQGICFIGEVGLDGRVKRANGVLPVVDMAKREGFKVCFVPRENQAEGRLIKGIETIGVESLAQAMDYLRHPPKAAAKGQGGPAAEHGGYDIDFKDIKGQHLAKRAAEIAAAGFHNILFIGPPGTGKSMLAKALPTILPPMEAAEWLEVTKIYSICGLLNQEAAVITRRPYRSPHHTISTPSLCGGGRIPGPGELTLAHRGVLFLDELTQFRPESLEALRQPLEDRQITISRLRHSYVFPADFILAAAMNPCACGYFPDRNRCRCQGKDIFRYFNRISGPFYDRMDLSVEVANQSYAHFMEPNKAESSKLVGRRVRLARRRQRKRYQGTDFLFNASLSGSLVEKYCSLDAEAEAYLEALYQNRDFNSRKYHKLLKVARTIADLADVDDITSRHLQEAVFYQAVDDKFGRMENG